jgi:hypothetical protein
MLRQLSDADRVKEDHLPSENAARQRFKKSVNGDGFLLDTADVVD